MSNFSTSVHTIGSGHLSGEHGPNKLNVSVTQWIDDLVDDQMVFSMRQHPVYRQSMYHDLDIRATLEFFMKRYVRPLQQVIDIFTSVVTDCAAGNGWFTFTYLLAGGKGVYAVDLDKGRQGHPFLQD